MLSAKFPYVLETFSLKDASAHKQSSSSYAKDSENLSKAIVRRNKEVDVKWSVVFSR